MSRAIKLCNCHTNLWDRFGLIRVAIGLNRYLIGPQDEVPEHPERMNEDVAAEPSSHPELRASPQAQTPGMELIPSVRPWAGRVPRQAGESPKVIEEIERKVPNTQDPAPQLLWTFVCHGDMMEVVEDEEVSEQVKELRAALASVSSYIEVS